MQRERGFTLIELLVAITVMSVLALMGWRGLDVLLRARSQVKEQTAQVSRLQTGLAQWSADLQAMIDTGSVPPLDFDGLVLRITRVDRSLPGQPLRVVAWSRRVIAEQHQGRGSWVRWQSPPLTERAQLDPAWAQAQRWARNPSQDDLALEVAIYGIEGWQLRYFRNNSWSNPLSADGRSEASASPGQASPPSPGLPEGLRLELQLSREQALAGSLVQDWARPFDTPPETGPRP
ncbi:MAG: prepilin-type N-terminal cleavage/methylation domain-containing protein [Betaproteobacteria bacterium]